MTSSSSLSSGVGLEAGASSAPEIQYFSNGSDGEWLQGSNSCSGIVESILKIFLALCEKMSFIFEKGR